jgi:hypothetical protein
MAAINVDYASAFKNCGLDFAPFEAKGVKVSMTMSGMKFSLGGEVLATVPLAPGKISELAANFNSSSQAHQTAKATLVAVFKNLEKKLIEPPPAKAPFLNAPAATVPPAAQMHDVETTPLDKMKTEAPVKLKIASKLFQPVLGTSAGSKYFVVGLGSGIRVAARYKGSAEHGKLSVRIEGDSFPKLTMKIQEAGVFGPTFAGKFDSDYASMHVAVAGKSEAQRVIGAVLGCMAPFISHPCPDIEPLLKVAAA